MSTSHPDGTPRRKRRLNVLVAVLAAFMLIAAACGDDDDDGGSSSEGGGGSSSGTEEEGGGVSGDPVKIGVIASLSGPAAQIGEDQVAGLELKVEELNAADGILGRPVELIVKDDGGDPTKASQVMRELVDQEEVKLVFGPTLSSPALASAPIAMDAGVLMFPTSVAPELGDPGEFPYVFRAAPPATLQAQTFADYIEAAGWTKVGLLAVNNALGSSNVEAFKGIVAGSDIEIVDTQTFETGAVDVGPQIGNLERAGAEVVLALSTAVPDQVASVKARNAIEWDVPILGFSTMANPLMVDGVGGLANLKDVYAGQQYLYLTQGNPPSQTEEFLEKMREKRGETALTRDVAQSAAGYDVLTMMAEAINEVGDLDDPDALAAAVEDGSPWDLVKGVYEYSAESHEGDSLDTLAFVVAGSFEDGLYELAPNQ
ncbi:MAG: ABC transporter substrate-binding protein [Acidimicrobiia bacterium]